MCERLTKVLIFFITFKKKGRVNKKKKEIKKKGEKNGEF